MSEARTVSPPRFCSSLVLSFLRTVTKGRGAAQNVFSFQIRESLLPEVWRRNGLAGENEIVDNLFGPGANDEDFRVQTLTPRSFSCSIWFEVISLLRGPCLIAAPMWLTFLITAAYSPSFVVFISQRWRR